MLKFIQMDKTYTTVGNSKKMINFLGFSRICNIKSYFKDTLSSTR